MAFLSFLSYQKNEPLAQHLFPSKCILSFFWSTFTQAYLNFSCETDPPKSLRERLTPGLQPYYFTPVFQELHFFSAERHLI